MARPRERAHPVILRSSLPPLTVVRAVFRADELQRVPRFLGTTVHGVLGRALHGTVRAFPQRRACAGCPLLARCAYPALFDTPAPADPVLRAQGIRDMAPRPLVLAPDPDWRDIRGTARLLNPGDEAAVRVTPIGPAAANLPLVAIALGRPHGSRGCPTCSGDERAPDRRAEKIDSVSFGETGRSWGISSYLPRLCLLECRLRLAIARAKAGILVLSLEAVFRALLKRLRLRLEKNLGRLPNRPLALVQCRVFPKLRARKRRVVESDGLIHRLLSHAEETCGDVGTAPDRVGAPLALEVRAGA